jgi:hypothetical protein
VGSRVHGRDLSSFRASTIAASYRDPQASAHATHEVEPQILRAMDEKKRLLDGLGGELTQREQLRFEPSCASSVVKWSPVHG